jgi:hypothetical protein
VEQAQTNFESEVLVVGTRTNVAISGEMQRMEFLASFLPQRSHKNLNCTTEYLVQLDSKKI